MLLPRGGERNRGNIETGMVGGRRRRRKWERQCERERERERIVKKCYVTISVNGSPSVSQACNRVIFLQFIHVTCAESRGKRSLTSRYARTVNSPRVSEQCLSWKRRATLREQRRGSSLITPSCTGRKRERERERKRKFLVKQYERLKLPLPPRSRN